MVVDPSCPEHRRGVLDFSQAPNMFTELVEDIGNSPYSIYVDESSDVSKKKYLCICVRYFNKKEMRHVTEFLGMIEIEEADHVSLYEPLVAYFSLMNLPLENMIAIGTDGGRNLCGAHKSHYTLLKEKIPNLQSIKCLCHSLNLVASSAADEFPSSFPSNFCCEKFTIGSAIVHCVELSTCDYGLH